MRAHGRHMALALLLLIWPTAGFRVSLDGAVEVLDVDENGSMHNRSMPVPNTGLANQCAGKWRDKPRYKCDSELRSFIQQVSPYYDDFVVDMRVPANHQKMRAIARCYMDDPCFKEPRQPAFMHVSKDPFEALKGMHYFSYEEWWYGLRQAWHSMRNHPAGSTAERKTILVVPFFGGAMAGTSGKSNPDFDQELASFPEMFYKSELWTQMHLLYEFAEEIVGIAFVGRGSDKYRIKPAVLENICETDAYGHHLPEHKACNFALAFDVTYSGLQLTGDAQDMFGSQGANLLGQMTYGTVLNRADTSRKLVLLGVTHNNWYADYLRKYESGQMQYHVILGHNSKTSYRGPSSRIPGGKLPMLIPQFKIPDGASLDPDTATHLEFLFCCCGYDTRRPPYKVYRDFSPKPCKPSSIAGSKTCDFVIGHCPAMFPSYPGAVHPDASDHHAERDNSVLKIIQKRWRAKKIHSRSDLFRELDTNDSGRLNDDEWAGMKAMLKKWGEKKVDSKTLMANFEFLCEYAPGCDPGDPNNRGVTDKEFKAILDQQ